MQYLVHFLLILLSHININNFVPGSGKGHDAFFLASLGHDVYALDFSKEAINSMIENVKKKNININILNKDIFDMEKYHGSFDIILEYTFFCAIPPSSRIKYIKTAFNLLKDNGSTEVIIKLKENNTELTFKLKNKRLINRKSINTLRNEHISAIIH